MELIQSQTAFPMLAMHDMEICAKFVAGLNEFVPREFN